MFRLAGPLRHRVAPVMAIVLLILIAGSATAADRTALLIGNSRYPDGNVPEAANHVRDLKARLESLNYRVRTVTDGDPDTVRQAFARLCADTPTNGVAVVYYCGQVLQVPEGKAAGGYLVPAGIKLGKDSDANKSCVSLQTLAEDLETKCGCRSAAIIVDAPQPCPLADGRTNNVTAGLPKFDNWPASVGLLTAASTFTPTTGAAEDRQNQPATPSLTTQLITASKQAPKSIQHWLQQTERELRKSADDEVAIMLKTPEELQLDVAATEPAPPERPYVGRTAGDVWVNSAGMTFRWCPPGEFTMGCVDFEHPARSDARPVSVTISQGFWLAQHEITQRESIEITNRDRITKVFPRGKNIAYTEITTNSGKDMCKRLNERERKSGLLLDGWEYIMPTEAEWEYACRAGAKNRFSFGDDAAQLHKYGNFADAALLREDDNYRYGDNTQDDGSGLGPCDVGRYLPNAWGLHDMHGNLAEGCRDAHSDPLPGGVDPFVEKGGDTIFRGGSWLSTADSCRCGFRNSLHGNTKTTFLGIRVMLRPKR